jgi:hypothetical protein
LQPSRRFNGSKQQLLHLTVRSPVLILWVMYVLLVPVYVFKSGLPQPGDWMVLILAPTVLATWDRRLSASFALSIRALMWFSAYVIGSAVVWTALTGKLTLSLNQGFVLTPVFYVYNALMFISTLILHRRYGKIFIQVTVYAIIVSLWMQAGLAVVLARGDLRNSGLFDNPNQLGYFALIACSMLVLLRSSARISTLLFSLTMIAAAYLALLSASKAALAGMAVIVALEFISRIRSALILALGVALALSPGSPVRNAMDKADRRIRNDDHQSMVMERGYDRIEKYPEYLILGAGEGGYKRFAPSPELRALELHSSVGTLFFCYGVVGLFLFGNFIRWVVKGMPLKRAILLLPVAAYGMVHQGLRFTMLWLLLALVMCVTADITPPSRARGSRSRVE